jgi:drug/metabolite transporter (DMT)-like permease
MKTRAWFLFWVLGIIWGSSFLFIRIGVMEFRPIEIVFIRTAIAAIGLSGLVYFRGLPIPWDRKLLWALFLNGIGNVIVPYMLITWGEQYIESGPAAVLQSTAALFSLVIAHFAFTDERMNAKKVIGLIVGFIGVIILFSDQLNGETLLTDGLVGGLAVVGASLFYAIFTSYSRTILQRGVKPEVVAASSMIVGAVLTAPFVFFTEGGLTPLNSVSTDALYAILLLGFLNTFVAYIFFYYIIEQLGASIAPMVTYLSPVVGLSLGALFLNEQVGIQLIIGAVLILAGVAIVNLKRKPKAV